MHKMGLYSAHCAGCGEKKYFDQQKCVEQNTHNTMQIQIQDCEYKLNCKTYASAKTDEKAKSEGGQYAPKL